MQQNSNGANDDADINVLFPFHIPIYLPRRLADAFLDVLAAVRVLPTRAETPLSGARSTLVILNFPMNFVTAPLIADLFLLAISAIGREEVRGGTLGTDHISPLDIMLFFITLAYIAISIDASGLIRWLAYKVLLWGGGSGRRLFFYLYTFFAVLGSFIGNDPIILSGTPFLAYMTRVSSNISHPRAWIFTQFAVANIVSAILVSSNPTNLVLAGAFQVRFIDYTVNIIVPVVITVIVLFPCLLYVVFRKEYLIPRSITLHELPEEVRAETPKNPCIPYARGAAEEEENIHADDEQGKLIELAEIMHPFLDKQSAIFGSLVIATTLIVVLVLNAVKPTGGDLPVFWVTLPAAVVMFCWDLGRGWLGRGLSRKIAHDGRRELDEARAEHARESGTSRPGGFDPSETRSNSEPRTSREDAQGNGNEKNFATRSPDNESTSGVDTADTIIRGQPSSSPDVGEGTGNWEKSLGVGNRTGSSAGSSSSEVEKPTLVSLVSDAWTWSRETFPTASFVLAHLPLALVPFAFTMFVLVQALVTKGWVPVFAYGWDHWVSRTGTIGAIGGMGFVSVILCNVSGFLVDMWCSIRLIFCQQFAGTNIGTTILICRVLQAWQLIHEQNGTPISNRTFWATVYSMALGVNYGAFSTAFSASLAGLLWQDILGRKHIHIRARDFARFNVPIITISMVVGCAVLIGEVYLMRDTEPYVPS